MRLAAVLPKWGRVYDRALKEAPKPSRAFSRITVAGLFAVLIPVAFTWGTPSTGTARAGDAHPRASVSAPARRPPTTRIVRGPHRTVRTIQKRSLARFRFRSDRRRARFECRFDGRRWRRCKSPVRRRVGPGEHRFAVRTRDRDGLVDRSESRRRWRVDVGWRDFGFRPGLTAPTASSVKVMLMVAYLRGGAPHRDLDAGEKDLLGRMIRFSDNGAASTVRDIAGEQAIRRLARRAHMRDFEYSPIWGICRTSARNQAFFMRNLERYVPRRHRPFVRRVLGHITESQSWGISQVRTRGWSLRFKGGWGISDGRYGGTVNHQIALLQRGRRRIGIAILTQGNSTTEGGQQTLEGVARRLLHGLPQRDLR